MENILRKSFDNLIIKIRALLGFSRVLISSFALAQAGLATVFALKGLPSMRIFILGSIACLSGSYALTATNDLFDYKIDRERLKNLRTVEGFDMGQIFIRQPLARGIISFRTAITWILSLSLISLVFAYQIKPNLVVVALFIAALVVAYSALSKLSVLKLFLVGLLVAMGAAAGWLAVSSNSYLLYIFIIWMFLWEIGGRNIPNDFADVEEDGHLELKTIPIVYGAKKASQICFVCLLANFILGIILAILIDINIFFSIAVVPIGIIMLLVPSYRLLKKPEPKIALRLFNVAVFYPLTILITLLFCIYVFS